MNSNGAVTAIKKKESDSLPLFKKLYRIRIIMITHNQKTIY